MPRARNDDAPIGISEPVIEGRYVELDDYTVSFETFPVASDPGPLFAGLPDDRCQCPHWGYVISGRMRFVFADHEEVYEAGDAFYTPPGHAPLIREPGTEVIMFSPTAELRVTEEVMMRNMQAMQLG